MQEGGAFLGKNQVRKADTGDRARRARTQDRKGGEVGLAVLATRAEPSVRGAKGAKVDKMTPRDGQNGTKMDNLAGFGHVAQTLHYLWRNRDRQGACDKRYRSAKSQKQLLPPLSPLRTLRSVHIGDPKAATPTDRKQRKLFNLGFRNQTR